MRGRAYIVVLLGLALLTTPLVTVAHPWSTPALIDRTTTFDGADTYVLTLRSDEPFRILNNSFVRVWGLFNHSVQDAGAMLGLVEHQGHCGPQDVCFVSMVGASLKDDGDVRVSTHGPVNYTVENDPNGFTFASLGTGIEFAQPWWLRAGTYRIFVTVPDADRVKADVHLHLNKPVTVHSEVAHDGGFIATGDDFKPTVSVDTLPASAMVQGDVVVDHDPATDGALFAYLSPSWFGTSVVDLFGGGAALTHNTVATGNYGIERPNGNCPGCGTGVALGGPSGPILTNPQQSGDYRFFTNWYVGAGPADMYLVGFQGAI